MASDRYSHSPSAARAGVSGEAGTLPGGSDDAGAMVLRVLLACAIFALGAFTFGSVVSWSATDPSLNVASSAAPINVFGGVGAIWADLLRQLFGWGSYAVGLILIWISVERLALGARPHWIGWAFGLGGFALLLATLGGLPLPRFWILAGGLGGLMGDGLHALIRAPMAWLQMPGAGVVATIISALGMLFCGSIALGIRKADFMAGLDLGMELARDLGHRIAALAFAGWDRITGGPREERDDEAALWPLGGPDERYPGALDDDADEDAHDGLDLPDQPRAGPDGVELADTAGKRNQPTGQTPERPRAQPQTAAPTRPLSKPRRGQGYQPPSVELMAPPPPRKATLTELELRAQAGRLAEVLADFGVKGRIVDVSPGPVVTLYELEPAPGVKSSRVIALADDIARSMSAAAARVAVVPGRNAIGIELPNPSRETVYLRELLSSPGFARTRASLPMALGETIGGEPLIADLARMPHLLIAGTTGSGKSVGINAMILSLMYHHSPETCRFIMIDPKMLELSIYEGVPHLLSPVVIDPKKAVVALKWTVREMEDRYLRMSKIGVRNITGYNERAEAALKSGKPVTRNVHTGYDEETGQPLYETETYELEKLPHIVVVIDEMADLMMVAGKEIEGAVQRLAQMARAAGIHLITATQRPSVDVITGTIKANFPTRISYMVTSKIDSRTILGEQGAEQLLGQGDLLFMTNGGKITRLHGPFVSDEEVEAIAAHLKAQGSPNYRPDVTEDPDEDDPFTAMLNGGGSGDSGDDLYDQALAVVLRDKKASTSYIQRRLQIGYNRAATLIERMENEGVVGPANHAGKREILLKSSLEDQD
jgi:DNA segregation ATPase FtsK/SpoIIIE, S-DNA-T family